MIVIKMIREAEKYWLKLHVQSQLLKLIIGVKFRGGIESNILDKQNAAWNCVTNIYV